MHIEIEITMSLFSLITYNQNFKLGVNFKNRTDFRAQNKADLLPQNLMSLLVKKWTNQPIDNMTNEKLFICAWILIEL